MTSQSDKSQDERLDRLERRQDAIVKKVDLLQASVDQGNAITARILAILEEYSPTPKSNDNHDN